MASSSSPQPGWIWSAEHNNWYYYALNAQGVMTSYWASNPQQPPAPVHDVPFHSRTDSGGSATAVMPDPLPHNARAQLGANFIQGTPEKGWYEPLDPEYRVRTGAEAYHFFKVGKVFSMLHIQAACPNAIPSDNVTVVKYGEQAFSQIRRFAIVDARNGFVYACPITTYSSRATLKPGCNPREHSAVHLSGQSAYLLPGESLEKESLRIIPIDTSIQFNPLSRIHYSKVFPIEMNVKVKDLGDVHPQDIPNLLRYYKEETLRG